MLTAMHNSSAHRWCLTLTIGNNTRKSARDVEIRRILLRASTSSSKLVQRPVYFTRGKSVQKQNDTAVGDTPGTKRSRDEFESETEAKEGDVDENGKSGSDDDSIIFID